MNIVARDNGIGIEIISENGDPFTTRFQGFTTVDGVGVPTAKGWGLETGENRSRINITYTTEQTESGKISFSGDVFPRGRVELEIPGIANAAANQNNGRGLGLGLGNNSLSVTDTNLKIVQDTLASLDTLLGEIRSIVANPQTASGFLSTTQSFDMNSDSAAAAARRAGEQFFEQPELALATQANVSAQAALNVLR